MFKMVRDFKNKESFPKWSVMGVYAVGPRNSLPRTDVRRRVKRECQKQYPNLHVSTSPKAMFLVLQHGFSRRAIKPGEALVSMSSFYA
ncbi:UNVERIFIED_CONTAM: hypothetical protein Slati_3881600 [Sesamum latifolium]|uniref:Uncharacterized protein n=1 Tax=Sesamum latifolium TaxID=2727402 RepID=A0AAW2TLN2_9LAMI